MATGQLTLWPTRTRTLSEVVNGVFEIGTSASATKRFGVGGIARRKISTVETILLRKRLGTFTSGGKKLDARRASR